MSEIIKYLKKWIRLYYIRGGLWLAIVMLTVFGVGLKSVTDEVIIINIDRFKVSLTSVYIAVTLYLFCLWLYSLIYLSLEIDGKAGKEPYRINVGIHNSDDIMKLLGKKMSLIKYNDECSYAEFVRPVGIDWRIFVFSVHRNSDDYLKIATQYVEKITKETGFKPVLRSYSKQLPGGYSQKGQILIYSHVSESVINEAQKNVENDVSSMEPLVSFFIDLTEGILIIPRLNTPRNVLRSYRPYLYAIEQIAEYFGDC